MDILKRGIGFVAGKSNERMESFKQTVDALKQKGYSCLVVPDCSQSFVFNGFLFAICADSDVSFPKSLTEIQQIFL